MLCGHACTVACKFVQNAGLRVAARFAGEERCDFMNLANLARKIIKTNYYMTLSTADGSEPWASPLFFSNDKSYNFYFVSYVSSKHAINILNNGRVAAAIFDSRQKPGTGNGVYIKGRAEIVDDSELKKFFPSHWKKHFPSKAERDKHDLSEKRFSGKSELKFFKLIPEKFWVLDPNDSIGRRVEVKL